MIGIPIIMDALFTSEPLLEFRRLLEWIQYII